MSGIAGQLRFDSAPADAALLENMGRLLAHRGRDGTALYAKGGQGLVLKAFAKPAAAEKECRIPNAAEGRVFALLDGFFTGAAPLAKQMGLPPDTESAELLLAAYLAYGREAFASLDGAFAAVVLDLRGGVLILARDRAGAKPLYYHRGAAAFSFASEVKALVKTGCAPARVDEKGLKEYLALQMYMDGRTLFKNISTLPPGHSLCVPLSGAPPRLEPYWQPPAVPLNIGYDEAVTQLGALVDKAVGENCEVPGPLGAFISGGLDSSWVAALAGRRIGPAGKENFYTYSSVYPDMRFEDERPYSDAVAASIASRHHRVRIPSEQAVKDHEGLIYMLDMPCAGFSAPYRTLAGIVRKDVKTVLTGHGGDEFFCGYPKTAAAALAFALQEAKDGRPFNFDIKLMPYLERFEPLVRHVFGEALFCGKHALVRALTFRGTLLSDALAPALKVPDEIHDIAEILLEKMELRGGGIVRQLMHLDQTIELPALLLVEDRTHMAENLEARLPLLSRELMEFSLSLPESYFMREGLKGLFRAAARGVLPAAVTGRVVKSGTMFPVQELFFGPMYPEVQKTIALLDGSGLFSVPALALAEGKGAGAREVWALWSLASWVREFL